MSDDDSDDDLLLTTPVFRSSDRRKTLKQQKNHHAIAALIQQSKRHAEESLLIQQMQVEQAEQEFQRIQETSTTTVFKRKVDVTQSGFFAVEESEVLDVAERKRRCRMLEQMKGKYEEKEVIPTHAFEVTSSFYGSIQDAVQDLRSIAPKHAALQKVVSRSVYESPHHLNLLLRFLPNHPPTDLFQWLFRVAISQGLGDMRAIGIGATHALLQNCPSEPFVSMEEMTHILGHWRCENGWNRQNKAGLTNLLRIVAKVVAPAPTFQTLLTDLCTWLIQNNSFRDTTDLLRAAEEVQVMLSTDEHADMAQRAEQMMKDWSDAPVVAKLLPFYGDMGKLDTAACSMNAHLSLQAIRHCLPDDVSFDDLLMQTFQLWDEDGKDPPLSRQAIVASFGALQALRTHLEGLNSVKEAHTQHCCAIGQAAILAFTSGMLLLGMTVPHEEGGKEYGTRDEMSFLFRLCDKLGAPLDYLTTYTNRYTADEHFRRLNGWLMILDFYRLETLRQLKPKFDDDTLVQKDLTSFFTRIAT
ncbi:hypothetical protein FisN_15Lh268 [Fistulifera solaris]|uniref:Uncharacterized protein n=1 Tax=Fistulifera solaris TaxID=1519565 RepID=A0A1Z5K1T6_FISSO|nr:hypothetical protein FisN_15Lh268 [Fistulifera solaris]|eukprot:GAX20250.1 hypothetical protein FisN_15Lh268 [Fistulifera solaris]